LRVAENNKNIREAIFGAGLVQTCPKLCSCDNCGIAKKYPNNLEKLIDTVYSPTKREAIRSISAQSKSSKKATSILPTPNSEAATTSKVPSPPLTELDIPDSDSPVSSPVSVRLMMMARPRLIIPTAGVQAESANGRVLHLA
jgi:hypothetical protein